MVVVIMSKSDFNIIQLNNVNSIVYDSITKSYTITYNTSTTISYNGNYYTVSILM